MNALLEVLRHEKKYSVDLATASILRRRLAAVMQADPHNGADGYLVRSLYFDTPDNADFRDKVDGLDCRRKVRLRVYTPDDAFAKLELKEKQGDDQRKRSLTLTRADAVQVCAGDYSPLLRYDDLFAGEMYGRMTSKLYRPVCLVEYDRIAFLAPENDTRITLDLRVRAREYCADLFAPQTNCWPVCPRGEGTLEVKFSRFLLSYVKDAVSAADKMQVSRSKYCLARNTTLRDDE